MKKCLIVVDYQNDFVTGALGNPDALKLERSIADKIRQYRDNGGAVIFTFDTHSEGYMQTQEGRNLPVPHCLQGTEGHMLFGAVNGLALESDLKFEKITFGSDLLYAHLRQTPYESIELAGVVSNICVISNAVLAKTAQPETPVLVDANCVASNDARLNQAALDVMASLQIKIV